MLAYDYPLLGAFWTMFVFFIWIAWLFLLFKIFADIFRSQDLGGGAKALWCIFIILVPFLGTFVYVIARGKQMGEQDIEAAQAQQAAFEEYVADGRQRQRGRRAGQAGRPEGEGRAHRRRVRGAEGQAPRLTLGRAWRRWQIERPVLGRSPVVRTFRQGGG